jgi:hypothetical protein
MYLLQAITGLYNVETSQFHEFIPTPLSISKKKDALPEIDLLYYFSFFAPTSFQRYLALRSPFSPPPPHHLSPSLFLWTALL